MSDETAAPIKPEVLGLDITKKRTHGTWFKVGIHVRTREEAETIVRLVLAASQIGAGLETPEIKSKK